MYIAGRARRMGTVRSSALNGDKSLVLSLFSQRYIGFLKALSKNYVILFYLKILKKGVVSCIA